MHPTALTAVLVALLASFVVFWVVIDAAVVPVQLVALLASFVVFWIALDYRD